MERGIRGRGRNVSSALRWDRDLTLAPSLISNLHHIFAGKSIHLA